VVAGELRRAISIDTALPEAQNFGQLFKEQSQKTLKSNPRIFPHPLRSTLAALASKDSNPKT
jgi:hypothetical protein